jgi:hypothetical protein
MDTLPCSSPISRCLHQSVRRSRGLEVLRWPNTVVVFCTRRWSWTMLKTRLLSTSSIYLLHHPDRSNVYGQHSLSSRITSSRITSSRQRLSDIAIWPILRSEPLASNFSPPWASHTASKPSNHQVTGVQYTPLGLRTILPRDISSIQHAEALILGPATLHNSKDC